jgi:hypothetical protein
MVKKDGMTPWSTGGVRRSVKEARRDIWGGRQKSLAMLSSQEYFKPTAEETAARRRNGDASKRASSDGPGWLEDSRNQSHEGDPQREVV